MLGLGGPLQFFRGQLVMGMDVDGIIYIFFRCRDDLFLV